MGTTKLDKFGSFLNMTTFTSFEVFPQEETHSYTDLYAYVQLCFL